MSWVATEKFYRSTPLNRFYLTCNTSEFSDKVSHAFYTVATVWVETNALFSVNRAAKVNSFYRIQLKQGFTTLSKFNNFTLLAVSNLGPTINIRRSWRGFPTTVTAAVSIPTRRQPEGYKYFVFSRSKFVRNGSCCSYCCFYEAESVLLSFPFSKSLCCLHPPRAKCMLLSFSTNHQDKTSVKSQHCQAKLSDSTLTSFMLEISNKDHVWCGCRGGGDHADVNVIKGGVQSHPSFHFDDNTCSSQAKWFWVKDSVWSNDVCFQEWAPLLKSI